MSQAQEPIRASGKKSTRAKSSTGQKVVPPKQASPSEPLQEEKGDLATELWLRFGRFGWDAAGLGLIAFAIITLIGLISRSQNPAWAQGLLISAWVNLIAVAFGWGWPLVVVSIALLGLMGLRRRVGSLPKINLARVLALEGLAFSLLAFLSVLDGWSLDNAEAGMDGGVIGWGLAVLLDRVLPVPWGAVFLIGVMVLLFGYGTGLMAWMVRRLESWLNTINPPGEATNASMGAKDPANPTADAEFAAEDEDLPPPVPTGPQVRSSELPPLDLLLNEQNLRPDESYIQDTARQIEHTLSEFGVPALVKGYRVGPTVTQYAVEPGFIDKTSPDGDPVRQKVRVSQISALQRDLALALSAERLRIEAPVPGRSYVGIEVPNQLNTVVRLRSLLECPEFYKLSSPLAVAMGKDVSGEPLVADLSRMPHLLIAGTTGSGKSVCIGAIVTCLVMNNLPSDLRIALLDPKMVELVRFNGLPHMFGRVETEVDRMLGVLRWALMEMDHRYRLLEDAHSRDIFSYNRKMEKRGQPRLPRIVVLIDELADLMMTAPDQTEHSLIRLAQMARATGIHLVVATQRPSTDVVTGLIKANFPARLAFSVASSIDSRVILDGSGAESLLGKGDMLFLNPEAGTPLRAQGVMVSDDEIDAVLAFWKQKTGGAPADEVPPWEELLQNPDEEDSDALVEQAAKIVRATQRASTSLLQRRLRIGYPRAARLMDQLEELGVVGPSQGGGRERDVLEPPEDSEAAGDGAEDGSPSNGHER
jgi:S-DNA-T family DNA segregation ATPase FtsK/SpoIIIE